MMLDGIEATRYVGTEAGTFSHQTIATDGDEAVTTTSSDGKLETHDIGTATGETQFDGTVTTDGTVTNELYGTETTAVLGIEAITLNGTESGT